MSESFKTCFFGGFDKQDVVNFIEQQSKAHSEEMEALQPFSRKEFVDSLFKQND